VRLVANQPIKLNLTERIRSGAIGGERLVRGDDQIVILCDFFRVFNAILPVIHENTQA
jgi:hypothetical protein